MGWWIVALVGLLVSLEKSGEGCALHASRWEVKSHFVRPGKVTPDGRLLARASE